MDWDKQDNELRKLMDGSEFLPEGELWDAGESWKKLQRKNQTVKTNRRIIWLRLATAACVVGLLAMALVWFQHGNFKKPMVESVSTRGENESKTGIHAEVMDSIKNQVQTHSTSAAIIHLPKNIHTITANAIQVENENHSIQRNNNKEDEELSNTAVVSTNIEGPENAIVINEVAANTDKGTLAEVTTSEAEMQTLAVVPARVKKIKVIHYNELKGTPPTPPPGFAQIKKSQFEWESIAMQASSTPKETSFQLKIELFPVPKKSP